MGSFVFVTTQKETLVIVMPMQFCCFIFCIFCHDSLLLVDNVCEVSICTHLQFFMFEHVHCCIFLTNEKCCDI
jgi:hypothetical protein